MKTKRNLYKFLVFSTLSFSIMSHAEAQDSEQLSDVLVLSDRIQIPFKKQNRNIQILRNEDIQKLPVKSVNELLQYIGGVDVRQKGPNGAQADIGIDGGTFDQTLLLVNGFKLSDPQTGHNMMNIPIPLDAIERIEVLKGAAARIYGLNALMGVINIVTKSSESNQTWVRAAVGSSFDKDDSTNSTYYNALISAVQSIATDKSQHLIAAGYENSNGYRYNTAYDQYKLLYSGKTQLNKKTGLEWLGGYVRNEFGANNYYAAPNDKEAIETVENVNLGLKIPIQINNNQSLKFQGHYRYGLDDYIFTRKNPEVYRNIHHTNVVDINADYTIINDWGNINIGANYRNESINSTNLKEHSRDNIGGFISYQHNFFNRLDMNAGIYFNNNSVFGFKMYPGIDLGYNFNNDWRIYGNIGLGQRIPTFTDLYYTSPTNLGNEQLQPENIISYELGLKKIAKNFRLNTSVFYKSGTDFIDWIRNNTADAWQVYNFTTLNTLGFHLDAQYGIDLKNGGKVTLFTSYTYLDPKIGKPTDKDMQGYQSQYAINALQHQWATRIHYNYNKFNIALGNKFQNRITERDQVNDYKVKSFNILDARIGYDLNKANIYLDFNNITNVKYIESGVVPLAGRWMTIGCQFKF